MCCLHIRTSLPPHLTQRYPQVMQLSCIYLEHSYKHVWKNAHVPVHYIMSHKLMYTGFMLDEKINILTPIMMTKCPMPKAVIEIISFNCKFSCDTKNCSYFKSRLRYTIRNHNKSKEICLCTNVNIN